MCKRATWSHSVFPTWELYIGSIAIEMIDALCFSWELAVIGSAPIFGLGLFDLQSRRKASVVEKPDRIERGLYSHEDTGFRVFAREVIDMFGVWSFDTIVQQGQNLCTWKWLNRSWVSLPCSGYLAGWEHVMSIRQTPHWKQSDLIRSYMFLLSLLIDTVFVTLFSLKEYLKVVER